MAYTDIFTKKQTYLQRILTFHFFPRKVRCVSTEQFERVGFMYVNIKERTHGA